MLEINDTNFQAEVGASELPVILDFWATWCAPCRALGPVFEKIAAEYDGKVKVGKVNVDTARGLAQKFNIRSIPVVLLFKDGEGIERMAGFDGTEGPLRALFEKAVSL